MATTMTKAAKAMTTSDRTMADAAREVGATALSAARMLAMAFGRQAHVVAAEALTAAAVRIAREGNMTRDQFLNQASKQWDDETQT